MANIAISVKGKFEINLTRHYNSLSVFNENKDDIGFNDSVNDFYNYCLSSPCGSWVGDKIKILTLPDKGRLFYNATPLSTPTYSNVTVGQEISVRDLIDYKVLKFSAEGSYNNQFTDNYFTTFTFERYCVATAQNVTVFTKLNMIDDKIPYSNVYITDKLETNGFTTYKLHVENLDFAGYILLSGNRSPNARNTSIKSTFATDLSIPNATPPFEDLYNSTPVTIPIGIHDITLQASALETTVGLGLQVSGNLNYSTTTNVLNSIIYVGIYLDIPEGG